MNWTIEYAPEAVKDLKRLDKTTAKRVLSYLERLTQVDDPHSRGKALTGPLKGLWRFRVGNYRIIAQIENSRVTILVLRISHRSTIYD